MDKKLEVSSWHLLWMIPLSVVIIAGMWLSFVILMGGFGGS